MKLSKTNNNWGLGLIPSGTLSRINKEWDSWFDSLFGDWNSWFPKTSYPVNVIVEKDKSGNVTHDIIEVALAGVNKDRVKVSVSSSGGVNYLNVNVSKKDDIRDTRYQGTTNKSFWASYVLTDNHDEKGIESELIDGLLKIKVPLKELKTIKEEKSERLIDIK